MLHLTCAKQISTIIGRLREFTEYDMVSISHRSNMTLHKTLKLKILLMQSDCRKRIKCNYVHNKNLQYTTV